MPDTATMTDARQTPAPERAAVACRVCGRVFRTLFRHLRHHGLTAEEYRQQYPGALTHCVEVHERLVRDGHRGREVLTRIYGIGYMPRRAGPTGANPGNATMDAATKAVVSGANPAVLGSHALKVAG